MPVLDVWGRGRLKLFHTKDTKFTKRNTKGVFIIPSSAWRRKSPHRFGKTCEGLGYAQPSTKKARIRE